MRLARLEVVDYRNHPAAAVDLEPGANLFVGPNGTGKTNLLEAVSYLATLTSYRSGQDAALVRADAPAAIIRASVERAVRRILIELEIRPGTGLRGRLNRVPVNRARDLLGALRAVVFAPEDMSLVRGDPDDRRRMLDALAVQRLPRYLAVKQDFDRILKQRNTLLRSAGGRSPGAAGLATLDVWDDRLAGAGALIWSQRLGVVEALRPRVADAYRDLAGRDLPVTVAYSSSLGDDVPDKAGVDPDELARLLVERLRRDRPRELERGVTLSGPHRDDVTLEINQLPARTHSSQGEAWSLALSLRLASHRWLSEDGEVPVLLLDDVFAELDRDRRRRLVEAALDADQVIITAAVPEEVPAELRATAFHVRPGSIMPFAAADEGPGVEVIVDVEAGARADAGAATGGAGVETDAIESVGPGAAVSPVGHPDAGRAPDPSPDPDTDPPVSS